MRIRLKNELLLLNCLALLLIIIIAFFPSSTLRIIIGLPLLLFVPGYVLLASLAPRRTSLNTVERAALSFGLSIAVTSFIGLLLNFTPWGIRLYPILAALATFILVTSLVAWYRRRRLPETERPSLFLSVTLPYWRVQSLTNKILFITLAIAILGAVGTLVYVSATPGIEESYTEFYLLGSDNKMKDYPKEAVVREEVKVVVGIVNHEYKMVNYRITVTINGMSNTNVVPLVLSHNEVWEQTVTVIPRLTGDNQKVEFFIYRNEESKPYLEPLHLWLNVKEATNIKQ